MKRSTIRRVSKKRAKDNALYTKLRKKYLEEHMICEVCNEKEATQIHHKLGRIHGRLNEVEHFTAICFSCHDWIHNHPEAARNAGWILLRNL